MQETVSPFPVFFSVLNQSQSKSYKISQNHRIIYVVTEAAFAMIQFSARLPTEYLYTVALQ